MAPNTKSEVAGPGDGYDESSESRSVVKEILYEGNYYDVTNFIKRHPGGSIIEYYVAHGEDATHAMQQFHQRSSKKIRLMLQSFKKRPATDRRMILGEEKLKRHQALTEDFNKLYLELEKEGMFRPSYVHNIYRISEIIAIGYVGYLLLFSQSYLIKLLGCLLLGLAQGRSGWVQHESGHHSLTGNPKADRLIHAVIFGLGLGLSSTWWARGHNRHHAMPQRLKHDVDLDTMPLIAYNARVVSKKEKGKSFLIQNQIYLFLTLDTLLGTLAWQLYLHPKYVLKHGYYLQAISIFGHYVLAYQCGFLPWLISTWALSAYLFGNFALSHTFLPMSLIGSSIHSCTLQMSNSDPGIEHHLFPTMPQFRHPLIKDRVKALAEKHNIKYYVYSYKEAVYRTFKNLSDVSEQLKEA
ncbi:Fatty acid desaturase 2 [Folsomia candida]|uniref:Fatty acid desaturase 2 n=1 Tax=Folsomia candida TaxID=158441 RepID=A0A226EFY7_FOLCA|nr:Fatty acid desaturase 2 [Folsomia candida]